MYNPSTRSTDEKKLPPPVPSEDDSELSRLRASSTKGLQCFPNEKLRHMANGAPDADIIYAIQEIECYKDVIFNVRFFFRTRFLQKPKGEGRLDENRKGFRLDRFKERNVQTSGQRPPGSIPADVQIRPSEIYSANRIDAACGPLSMGAFIERAELPPYLKQHLMAIARAPEGEHLVRLAPLWILARWNRGYWSLRSVTLGEYHRHISAINQYCSIQQIPPRQERQLSDSIKNILKKVKHE